MKKLKIFSSLLCLAFSWPSIALDLNQQAWLTTIWQGRISSPLGYYFEVQPRIDDNKKTDSRLILRPALLYHLNDQHSLWTGYMLQHAPESETKLIEHRAWQQWLSRTRYDQITLIHRLRSEQRWLNDNENLTSALHRLRYMARGMYRLTHNEDERQWWLIGSAEYFHSLSEAKNLVHRGADQIRVYAAGGVNLTSDMFLEFGYTHQHLWRPRLEDRVNHILTLNLIVGRL